MITVCLIMKLTPLKHRNMIVRVIHEAGSCLFDAQVQNMKTVILGPQNILNTVVFHCVSSVLC